MPKPTYPHTPDGRYFVARNRLWRTTDPTLDDDTRQHRVKELMAARRAVNHASDAVATRAARDRVDAAKIALGERGPVWWTDGAPDESRRHPKNTRYADWWQSLAAETRALGGR